MSVAGARCVDLFPGQDVPGDLHIQQCDENCVIFNGIFVFELLLELILTHMPVDVVTKFTNDDGRHDGCAPSILQLKQ